MRYALFEGAIIGGIIGVAVFAVRSVMSSASVLQFLVLGVVALVLCAAQLVFQARRRARAGLPKRQQLRRDASSARKPVVRDPFAHEANRSWTGLAETETTEPQEPLAARRE